MIGRVMNNGDGRAMNAKTRLEKKKRGGKKLQTVSEVARKSRKRIPSWIREGIHGYTDVLTRSMKERKE